MYLYVYCDSDSDSGSGSGSSSSSRSNNCNHRSRNDPPSSQRSSVLGAKPHGSTCIPDDPTSTRTHLNTDLT